MSITMITPEQLRRKNNEEGLVLEGCGGDLQDWVTGINDMLTKEGILLDGSRMENCESFSRSGLTCLYFPFEGAKLDMGKFAIWRLQSHAVFGGTWLSDYVPNRLGGFIPSAEANQAIDIAQ